MHALSPMHRVARQHRHGDRNRPCPDLVGGAIRAFIRGQNMTTNIDLSDAQRQILTAACGRKGGLVLPAATALKGGALKKVLGSLLSRGLVEEAPASGKQEVWRTGEDGTAFTLKATRAARQALGLDKPKRASKPARAAKASDGATKLPRADTKQARVIAMLKRPSGATVEQIIKATDWQPHSVRGFFAGALKKRLGIEVTSEQPEGGKRVYRIGS
jgi:Protein of unknown function (DUF3489)